MAPSRRKSGATKAAAAAAARRKWRVGDLVLAKVKGFPAWPASVGEPGSLGHSTDWKKILVHFYGTQQIAFCNPADVEAFTEEKKQSLLTKRHGKGSDFVRAVHEIIEKYDEQKKDEAAGFNSAHAAHMNCGNSGNSPESKDQLEAPEAVYGSQFNSSHSIADGNEESLPVDDTSATVQVDEVDKKEEPSDNAEVTEAPLNTVYSCRKRTRGMPSQNGLSERKEPIVRRSRSSSRLEYRRLQHSVLQSSDTDINSRSKVATMVCSGLLRRDRSKRKSFEASEHEDADLKGFASSGSIEDNSSEVVTVESDTFSLNEVSNTDSGCRIEHPETTVRSSAGDVMLSKGLDLQIKAVIIKKKRMPNRKRPTNDAVEHVTSVSKVDDFPNASESSRNDFEKMSGRCHKENGDEHLPLVKRARVRMGESSVKEPLSLRNAEENMQKDLMVHVSGETNNSSNCNDPKNGEPFCMNVALCASPLGGGSQCQRSKSSLWKAKKEQSFGSIDGEAALPPSKRIHRALEAMSANAAAKDQSCNAVSSDMNILTDGTLASLESKSPCVATESPIGCNVESIGSDAQRSDISGLGADFNLVSRKNIEATSETDLTSEKAESPKIQINETDKEYFLAADQENSGEGSRGGVVIPTAVLAPSPTHLLSSPCEKESVVAVAQGSEEESLPSKDKGNAESNELIHFISDKTNKKSDLYEIPAMDMDPVSGAQADIPELSPQADTGVLSNTENACFENSRSSDDNRDENDMCEMVAEAVGGVQIPKEPSSESFPSGYLCDGFGVHSSPCLTDGGNSLAQASPFNASSGRVSTSDNGSFIQNNGSCSPDVQLCHKTASHPSYVNEERKLASLFSERPKSVDKYTEADAALSSFEALLGSLSRTKESIGRATRLAIDCAKFGASSKVVDVLTHYLESESSLHRRVDLFFLVDSIVKGDAGGMYASSIQAMLPRLVAAVAPPGSSAHENRRQCLKVLRLWLEKKILSESVIRRHMRELDSYAITAAGAFSRRTLRTERSFDDPLREMEGMLVDEYGSNSSFQLPGFCMPSMLKDEDGGSDSDEGSFEAVTPEHSPVNYEDHTKIPANEKHRHILEDVDGELEMEDVAPTCEIEFTSSSGIGVSAAQVSQHQFEQHFSIPFAPPLPQDVPPSSPPLPSSPPPQPPARPPPIPPLGVGTACDTYANGVDSNLYSEHIQDNMTQSIAQQSNTPRNNQTMADAVRYHASEHRDFQRQMSESFVGRSFHNKNYPLRPPPPPPPNQFSFVRGEPHFKPRREGAPPPSHSHRYHVEQNWDRENFYNNHDRMNIVPHEPDESWRFPSHSFSGPRYSGKGKFYGPDPFSGPPAEHTRYPNQGWRHPPHSMSHRNPMPFRPPIEGPSYWQPR